MDREFIKKRAKEIRLVMAIAPVVAGIGFLSAPTMAEEVEPTDVVSDQTSMSTQEYTKADQDVSLTVSEQDVIDQESQSEVNAQLVEETNTEGTDKIESTTDPDIQEQKRVEGFRLLLSDELNKQLNGENASYPTTEKRELRYFELSSLSYENNHYTSKGQWEPTFANSALNTPPEWIILPESTVPILDDFDEYFNGWRLVNYKFVGTETVLHNGEYEYISHNYVAQYDKLIRTLYYIPNPNSASRDLYVDDESYGTVGSLRTDKVYNTTNYNGEFIEEKEHLNAPIVPIIDGLVFSHWEKLYNGWNYNNTAQYEARYKVVNGIMKTQSGSWKYYKDGKFEKFTGVAKSISNGKWYFVRNGVLDWNFTGVAKSVENGQWYHCNKGALDWNFTGVSKSVENGKWYFSRKGKLDWSFTGVAKSVENGQWYHCNKGALDWNFTGVSKSVENGKWYFSRKGKLDWAFTGVAKSVADGKWYHVTKGKLNWKYTGASKSVANGKYYYITKGRLNWNYNGYVRIGNRVRVVRKGKVL